MIRPGVWRATITNTTGGVTVTLAGDQRRGPLPVAFIAQQVSERTDPGGLPAVRVGRQVLVASAEFRRDAVGIIGTL